MSLTRRQARRRLGTRTNRRRDTNGKVIPGSNKGGNTRSQCRKNPRRVKSVAVRLERLLQKEGERLT